jgi:hypothetical protein
LAQRLADLRLRHWPDRTVTQRRLGRALGAGRPLSPPTISSWESVANPRIPRAEQLAAYARFFATQRSIEEGLLDDARLTEAERVRRGKLEDELLGLRTAALRPATAAIAAPADPLGEMWRFRDRRPVTIVCSDVGGELRRAIPHADPVDPDYEELYGYAELDALVELFGHIRAVNPTTEVTFRSASMLRPNDYTSHLVVLGGVGHNQLTRELHARLELPVRQVPEKDGFEPTDPADDRTFQPIVDETGDERMLIEDVAHVFRAPNPFNVRRTVTLCNAVYSRGILGAVRALTHSRFRNRNELYVQANFPSRWLFSVVMRVPVISGQTLTPDWTVPETLLHRWPSP